MKPTTVSDVLKIIKGELLQGDTETIIKFGAYRIKQVKHPNTILFMNTRLFNWSTITNHFPLILVSEYPYKKNEVPKDVVLIKVNKLDEAYWDFVEYYRNQFNIPIVAVTGTSGKTTTKEMLKHILAADRQVVATTLSNNSRTETLQNLLKMNGQTEVGVFETAVGTPGDILLAGRYYKPTIGIITNIGSHHLNYCKTQEAYINAKAEMLQIVDKGTLIINDDDLNILKIDTNYFPGKIIRFGKQNCHYRISDIRYGNRGMHFIVNHSRKQYEAFVPGYGEHQVYNATAALAAAHLIGVPLQQAIDRLKSYRPLNKQLQIFKGVNNSILIDDTWSITTTSLDAALEVLNAIGKGKKKIAIIGTITDLGSWGYIIHEQAGDIIFKHGVDVLITVGEHATIMADQARDLGLNAQIYNFRNNLFVYQLVEKLADADTVILIKGDMYSETIHELAAHLKLKTPPN